MKGLTEGQKMKIRAILGANKLIPADETISDVLKKRLRLSDKRYTELREELANFVDEFFGALSRS